MCIVVVHTSPCSAWIFPGFSGFRLHINLSELKCTPIGRLSWFSFVILPSAITKYDARVKTRYLKAPNEHTPLFFSRVWFFLLRYGLISLFHLSSSPCYPDPLLPPASSPCSMTHMVGRRASENESTRLTGRRGF